VPVHQKPERKEETTVPDEAGDDLLKRIDEQLQAEASQPGPDAMRWAPPPAEPADNAYPVTGMLLGVGIGAPVELAPDEDAGNVLLPMIGDPDAHRYCSVAGVTFWTGAHSVAYRHRNGGLNVLATHTLLAFLRAVITGDFSASNREATAHGRHCNRSRSFSVPAWCSDRTPTAR
jgi:hypothetical protein